MLLSARLFVIAAPMVLTAGFSAESPVKKLDPPSLLLFDCIVYAGSCLCKWRDILIVGHRYGVDLQCCPVDACSLITLQLFEPG